MTKRKRSKVPVLQYASEIDRLMREEFNQEFKTSWSLFAAAFGGYVTTRVVNGKPRELTVRQMTYLRGLSNGMGAAVNKSN